MISKQIVGIVDYKAGNLKSIFRTLNYIGVNYKMISHYKDFKDCDKLILPGVGNFDYCMKYLKKNKLDIELKQAANQNKIIYGICMGMQIMFKTSEESKTSKGLNLINGKVQSIKSYFQTKLRTPHIGWNKIICEKNDEHKDILDNKYFYFANSYVCETNDKCKKSFFKYQNKKFISFINKENIFGTQFHPEISGRNGPKVYERFLKL
jgi:glutamine amidotransferase